MGRLKNHKLYEPKTGGDSKRDSVGGEKGRRVLQIHDGDYLPGSAVVGHGRSIARQKREEQL